MKKHEYRKITTLKNWSKNPRAIKKADFRRLKWQILRLGQYKPTIITPDGVLVGGNMRFRAYKALIEEVKKTSINAVSKRYDVPASKVKEFHEEITKQGVSCSVVEPETDSEFLEYALSDNDRAGYYEEDALGKLMFDNPKIEFENYKLDLGQQVGSKEFMLRFGPVELIEDEPPEVDEGSPAVSQKGAIYQLGDHRLLCGDSLDTTAIKALMDGEAARMVFTDPPYNVNYGATMKDKLRGTDNRKIKNDDMSADDFQLFLTDAIAAFKNFVSGDVYIFMSSSNLHTLYNAFDANGGHWSTFIIWVKNTFTIGRSNYQRQYEPCLYGWFEGSSHYWSGTRKLSDVVKEDDAHVDALGNTFIKAENLPLDIWEFPKPSKSKHHPTMKPIKVCGRAIENSSKVGDIVLDVFGGSGSTLIAAEQLDRTCYMVELDPYYCDVIRKRYARFKGEESQWQELTPKIKQLGK